MATFESLLVQTIYCKWLKFSYNLIICQQRFLPLTKLPIFLKLILLFVLETVPELFLWATFVIIKIKLSANKPRINHA